MKKKLSLVSANNDLGYIDKKYVWHPYTQMKTWNSQINDIIVKGDGFYLITDDNRKILDGIASMWCNVWGYGINPVIESMIEQLKNLPNSSLFGLGNQTSTILAEKLIKLTKKMDKVFYSDNGSTAIEVALKMAIQYWHNKGNFSKTKFMSLKNGYHGDTIATMSVGFVGKYFDSYKPVLIKTIYAPTFSDYNEKYDESELMKLCLEKTEQILKEKSSTIAAFIMESGAQIAGGVNIYPKDYQKKISELCRKYNILFILDEIATGFGRLGNMIEFQSQQSNPDIVCYGKALNGGYFPIAVTLTTNKIYNEFLGEDGKNKQFFHGHTYTGHPVGCAACISNIDLYEKTNLIEQIQKNSKHIEMRMQEFSNFSIVGKIRHKGFLCATELIYNNKPINFVKNMPLGQYMMKESIKKGVFLRTLGNMITLIPSLAIPKNELDILIDKQYELVKTIEKIIL